MASAQASPTVSDARHSDSSLWSDKKIRQEHLTSRNHRDPVVARYWLASRGKRQPPKWQNQRRAFICEAFRRCGGPRLGKQPGKITPLAPVVNVDSV